MAANHRHYQNVVPIARCIVGIAVVVFLSSASIFYVWSRNQVDLQGRQIRDFERELVKLRKELDVVQGQIATRSSIATLQQAFDNGRFKLARIAQFEPIYRGLTPDGNEVRTISNPKRSPRP